MKTNKVKPFKPLGNRVKSGGKLKPNKSQKLDNLVSKLFSLNKPN